MTLAEATRQYQIALEEHRADPGELQELDLQAAECEMARLWVIHEAERLTL